jgi:hypothetical protein
MYRALFFQEKQIAHDGKNAFMYRPLLFHEMQI